MVVSLRRMWDEGVIPLWVVNLLPALPFPLSNLRPRSLLHRKMEEGAEGDMWSFELPTIA